MSADVKFWSVQYATPDGDREEVVIQADSIGADGTSVHFYRGNMLVAIVNHVAIVQRTRPELIDGRSPEVPEELQP